MNILKSEKIKFKHSGTLFMSFAVPVICGIFSMFFGGTYNAVSQTVYWWMSAFLYLLLQLVVYRNLQLEKKCGNYFNIESISVKKSAIYGSKIVWDIYYGLIGSFMIMAVIFFFRWSMPASSINDTLKILTGLLIIFINSLWIIPLFILLQKRISGVLIIFLNFIISLIVAPFIAGSKFFFLLPYSYPYKTAKYFFYIKESGDIIKGELLSTAKVEVIVACVLSILLFAILSLILYRRVRND